MKITKTELLKAHNVAYEILSFVDFNPKIHLDKVLIEDTSLEIFNPNDYPFDLSFNDLLNNLDKLFEEKDMNEIFKELGEDFVVKYIEYIQNTIHPRYKKLLISISKKLYFIKFRVFNNIENLLNIYEYAIDKITEKRIYYYEYLDSNSTNEDISFINMNSLEDFTIKLNGHITITAWCLEANKDFVIKNINKTIHDYLSKLINSLDSYTTIEKSNIKLQ